MSRSESKKEKLRCFTSCLSKNDCLRRRSITTSAATQGSRGLRSDLTLDADTLSRSNVSESAKMAQTRDWIERISTVSLEIPVRASSSSLSKNPNFSSEWSNSCGESGKKMDDCSCCAMNSLQGSQDLVNGSSGGEGSSSFSPSLAKRGHNNKRAHLPAHHLIAPHPSLATTGVDTSNILSCYDECCLNRITPSNCEVPGCYADGRLSDAIDYIGAMYASKNRETGSQCRRRRNPRSSDSTASIQSSLTNLNMSSPYGGSNSTIGGSSSYISLPTELVTVDLSGTKSLGITVVGHLNSRGDCGIYVGCIKKGGLAELSGRIKPGYLIMEVNDIDLEDMSNDTALAVFRTELQKGGEVRILFGKFWDMSESRLELTTGSTSDQDPLTTTLCLPPGHRNSVVISRCDNDPRHLEEESIDKTSHVVSRSRSRSRSRSVSRSRSRSRSGSRSASLSRSIRYVDLAMDRTLPRFASNSGLLRQDRFAHDVISCHAIIRCRFFFRFHAVLPPGFRI